MKPKGTIYLQLLQILHYKTRMSFAVDHHSAASAFILYYDCNFMVGKPQLVVNMPKQEESKRWMTSCQFAAFSRSSNQSVVFLFHVTELKEFCTHYKSMSLLETGST